MADLGVGSAPEKTMRTCLCAVLLADRLGAGEETRREVYYAALLEHVGCTAAAHEAAAYFRDDVAGVAQLSSSAGTALTVVQERR